MKTSKTHLLIVVIQQGHKFNADVQHHRKINLYVRALLTPLWVTVASTMKTWSIISSCSRNAISSTSTLTERKLQIQSVIKGSYLKSEKYHENDLLPCF